MKKSILAIGLAFSILLSSGVLEAGIKKKKVKLDLVEFPAISVNDIDYSSLNVQLAVGDVEFLEKKLSTTSATCTPTGAKGVDAIKTARQYSTYYYDVTYTAPEAILLVKDSSSEIVYSRVISEGGKKSRRFGYGSCNYVILADADIWRQAAQKNLTKDFDAQQTSFSTGIQNDITEMAKAAVAGGIFLQPVRMEFELVRAEDKKQDYSDLQHAYDTAYEGYAIYKAQGYNTETVESLERAIRV